MNAKTLHTIQHIKQKLNLKFDYCAEQVLKLRIEYDRYQRRASVETNEATLLELNTEMERILDAFDPYYTGQLCQQLEDTIQRHALNHVETALNILELDKQIQHLQTRSQHEVEKKMEILSELSECIRLRSEMILLDKEEAAYA